MPTISAASIRTSPGQLPHTALVVAKRAQRRLRWLPAVLLLLAGCAFVDRDVQLDYAAKARDTDTASTEKVSKSDKAAAEASLSRLPVVAVRTVSDLRADKKHVGEVRNGFGMHTADVHTKSDCAGWVRKALRTELRRAGFVVTDDPNRAEVLVDAEVVSVHCTATFSYSGDIIFNATATRDGIQIAGRRYAGSGGAGVNWSATENAFAETLDLALQDAVLQFVREIRTGPPTKVD